MWLYHVTSRGSNISYAYYVGYYHIPQRYLCMCACRVSVSWGWGGGWLMRISRWKHMAGEQAHTVVMTTWQQLTPMHMSILSGEILPPRFNPGSDTFCLLFFIHTHTHAHTHTSHITHYMLDTHMHRALYSLLYIYPSKQHCWLWRDGEQNCIHRGRK